MNSHQRRKYKRRQSRSWKIFDDYLKKLPTGISIPKCTAPENMRIIMREEPK